VRKTAFATPSGLYEFVSAPVGLTSVPGPFQRFMQFVLAEHIEAGYCVVYCDDIAIFSQSDDPLVHLQHLEAVLASLREHQLLAKGSKCEFMRREAEFLGFMVSGEGVRPLPSKIEAVLQIPVPETITHLRSFLGMCNFFRAHLLAFAEVSSPLTELLKGTNRGRQRLQWTLECDHAFAQLKDMLTSAPLLLHFDPSLHRAVHIDASQHAVGAVLLQWEENEQDPRLVCFLSRKLQGSQWHYDARNAEALAAQVALSAWRPLLYGVPFELVSDHAGLRHLFQQKAPSTRILWSCEFLAEFDFQEVQYVRGAANLVPDFLSRPWDAEAPDVGLHALSHPRPPKTSALEVLAAQSPPTVVCRWRRCLRQQRRHRFRHLCQSSRLHSSRMPFCRVWARRSTAVLTVCVGISVAMNRVYFVISAKVTSCSVFVSHGSRAILFCMRHMVTLLRGTWESLVWRLILRSFFGGPTCSETWLISFVVAARVQQLKALPGCCWWLTRSLVYPCSRSLIGVWTLLARCLSPAVAMI